MLVLKRTRVGYQRLADSLPVGRWIKMQKLVTLSRKPASPPDVNYWELLLLGPSR